MWAVFLSSLHIVNGTLNVTVTNQLCDDSSDATWSIVLCELLMVPMTMTVQRMKFWTYIYILQ